MASFLTAANPSSANNNLGSNYVINTGTSVLYYSPSIVSQATSFTGQPTVADLTSQVTNPGTVATAWGGSCLAISPVTGQSYSGYTITLPTSDATTPVFTAGDLVVTNGSVTALNVSITNGIMQTLTIQNAAGTSQYLTVEPSGATCFVPLSVETIYGPTSFLGQAGQVLLVDTAGDAVTVGSPTNPLTLTVYDSLIIEGNTTPDTLLVSAGANTYLSLNTTSALFSITNTPMQCNGTTSIYGAGAAAKFGVFVGATTGTPIFAVNTTLSEVISTSIMPLSSSSSTLGTNVDPWFAIYGVTVTQTSDANFKEAFEDLEPARCLETIAALNPTSFRGRPGTRLEALKERRLGLTAQNVSDALGNLGVECSCVEKGADGSLGLQYDQLIAVLIGAVQELARRRN
jgi:hypothetical protein